jgi:hypothetical protein
MAPTVPYINIASFVHSSAVVVLVFFSHTSHLTHPLFFSDTTLKNLHKKKSSMMVTLYVLNGEFDEAAIFRQWFIPNLVVCCIVTFPKVFGKSLKAE